LTDIARGLRPGTEFIRQSAIGRRVTPCDPPRRGVDALEERILLAEVEPEAGKIRLLALKFTAATASATSGVGAPGSAPGTRRSRIRSVALALLVGNWKRVMPTLFQAMPQKPPAVSNMRYWCAVRPIRWLSHFDLSWSS
jgi:hypothetical protein